MKRLCLYDNKSSFASLINATFASFNVYEIRIQMLLQYSCHMTTRRKMKIRTLGSHEPENYSLFNFLYTLASNKATKNLGYFVALSNLRGNSRSVKERLSMVWCTSRVSSWDVALVEMSTCPIWRCPVTNMLQEKTWCSWIRTYPGFRSIPQFMCHCDWYPVERGRERVSCFAQPRRETILASSKKIV